ncbi:uncharacterized protein HGUI_03472 [Hanseniaspora guilliermondii]|uniref:Uncharacterized protein n=1 Tax=Hanseniaspora guilliermondii TaxID=56406 RepID=A0A1L0B425_9ASCO|nr:uncharacterized protein HGUI_03472 [Hanseniaspora guilliermondii]
MFYYYHIDEAELFKTGKEVYSKSLNNLHEPFLRYIYLFNHLLLKKTLELCETYQELVAYVLSQLRRHFKKEVNIEEVMILYICPQDKSKDNYCILDNSLKNIVNHHIEIHNAYVSCERCSRKLTSLCNIQCHFKIINDTNVTDWQIYREFYLSLDKQFDEDLNNTVTFEDNTTIKEYYSLYDFQRIFSNKESKELTTVTNDDSITDAQSEYENSNRIIDALNKNIQQLRNELQQAVVISNQQRMEDIDDRANELLRNVLRARNGRYNLNFNDFSSSDSLDEVTFETTTSTSSDNDSVGSIYDDDNQYRSSNDYIDDTQNNFLNYPSSSHRQSSETLQYYMASQSTLLEDAEVEARYANSETSTISVFEGYQIEDLLEEDEWDLYAQGFFL